MRRPLKLMYLAGTQDPHAALSFLRSQRDDPGALYVPYIRQFLELCDNLSATGVVVSTRGPVRRTTAGRFTFYNAPNPLRKATGRRYELGQVLYGIFVTALCLAHRPQVVLVGDGIMHYATIPFLRLSGAKVILIFHNTLWTCFSPTPDRWRGIAVRFRTVFVTHVAAIMTASATISSNFLEVTDGQCVPLLEFLPTYMPRFFEDIPDAKACGSFQILFVGRIMPEKGIFDMVRIAAALRDEGYRNIRVTMCGQGPSETALTAAIEHASVQSIVCFGGQVDAAGMLGMYAQANVVIAPTTTGFREGFNQVVAEAALAGRPVVTSRVCPAATYISAGVRMAEPDDIGSYVQALKDEIASWGKETKSTPAHVIEQRFFDPSFGWRETARRAITHAIGSDIHPGQPELGSQSGRKVAKPQRGSQL